MPAKKAKPPDSLTRLADAMRDALASLKEQGGTSYPPRLRQLAARADSAATDEQVQAAAAKKAFTDRAVVTEKVNRKPALDALVYVKGDEPKPDPTGNLARRMLAVLESQRPLGAGSYPLKLSRLVELCGRKTLGTEEKKAAAHASFTATAILVAKPGGAAKVDPPVFLREELAAALPALLQFTLARVVTTTKTRGVTRSSTTTAFTPEEAAKRLVPELQEPLRAAIESGIAQHGLPAGVAWVLVKGKPYLFLTANLDSKAVPAVPTAPAASPEPAPVPTAAPMRDFAAAFREAFAQLDRRNGNTNFVKLADLRRALSGFHRDEFDAGLRALCVAGEFTLDSHEGLIGTLTPEEREAGIREPGSLLIYASRR